MTDAFSKLISALDARDKPVSVRSPTDSLTPMLLATVGRRTSRHVAVVTADSKRAQDLCTGINFFFGDRPLQERYAVALEGADTSPYRPIAPNRLEVMGRMSVLFRLVHGPEPSFTVMSSDILCRRLPPKDVVAAEAELVESGQELDREKLVTRLEQWGYARVTVVEDPGTYAVRGGIMDVFAPLYARPIRIDLFGDEVDSLRFFDPITQRSGKVLTEFTLGPAHDVILTPQTMARARDALRIHAGDIGIPAPQVRALLRELENGIRPLGVQGWLPAFYDTFGSVTDYLPTDTLWCIEDPSRIREATDALHIAEGQNFDQAIATRQLVFEPDTLLKTARVKPDLQLLNVAYEEDVRGTHQVSLNASDHRLLRQKLDTQRGADHAFEPAAESVREWLEVGRDVIVVGRTRGHVERLSGLFSQYGIEGTRSQKSVFEAEFQGPAQPMATGELRFVAGSLPHGFSLESMDPVVLGHDDLLPHHRRSRPTTKGTAIKTAALASFRELNQGDLVVHTDHGIGRYEGLATLGVDDVENDFLKLTYRAAAGSGAGPFSILYLPVYRLDRVQKYAAGDDAAPPLDRLGSPVWERTKQKARRSAEDIARQLLALQAAREAKSGFAFNPGGEYLDQFVADFVFEETPDQASAIAEVMADMDRIRPMDRLVCGDVGYGKTEVAMRSAFRAVLDGKQVAVLVPTTILCEQHRLTFEDRFRGYPVSIDALSRFRSPKERKAILSNVASGKVDIVIGTHRLLQKDVSFRNLGLLVVDEEHRFGVKHKERIKQLCETIDVLTLTATPIPRTLNMALAGLRDLSIISTPPIDRLAVRTLVSRSSETVIADAVRRELKRAGQIFFVHNRVQSIERVADKLRRLVPGARIAVGHGQMPEAQLESVMLSFMAGEIDVLVCTTIIESGLDIPRANTLIIDRADQFGLAQLYQLRGRVGRSRERAYCYLLLPEPGNLTDIARKRVSTIQRFSGLGSGFNIATMDMEIRGAGNLLGAKQAGHVREVGLELFCELLREAVEEMKAERDGDRNQSKPQASCEVKVAVSAFLPESYVPDVRLRLQFYKVIASVRNRAELGEVFSDLVDQCGRPPDEAKRLFEVTELKIQCQQLGAGTFSYSRGAVLLGLDPGSPLAGAAVVPLLQKSGSRWKLTPKIELVRQISEAEWKQGLKTAREAVNELSQYVKTQGVG